MAVFVNTHFVVIGTRADSHEIIAMKGPDIALDNPRRYAMLPQAAGSE